MIPLRSMSQIWLHDRITWGRFLNLDALAISQASKSISLSGETQIFVFYKVLQVIQYAATALQSFLGKLSFQCI